MACKHVVSTLEMHFECTYIYLTVYVTLLMGLYGDVHLTTAPILMEVTFTFWGPASFVSEVKQSITTLIIHNLESSIKKCVIYKVFGFLSMNVIAFD